MVDAQHCVKSGVPTSERLVIRGSMLPDWTWLIAPFAFFIWIFVMLMTSRNYVVEVPFRHSIHRRWKRIRRVAWLLAVLGGSLFVWALQADLERPWLMLGLIALGMGVGVVNAWVNNVGVRLVDQDQVALTRTHIEFAADVRMARAAAPA